MPSAPYRNDPDAALRRLADMQSEVERLRAELTSLRARECRDDDPRGDHFLRVANVELRRENEELRQRLEPKPRGAETTPDFPWFRPWFFGVVLALVATFVLLLAALDHPR